MLLRKLLQSLYLKMYMSNNVSPLWKEMDIFLNFPFKGSKLKIRHFLLFLWSRYSSFIKSSYRWWKKCILQLHSWKSFLHTIQNRKSLQSRRVIGNFSYFLSHKHRIWILRTIRNHNHCQDYSKSQKSYPSTLLADLKSELGKVGACRVPLRVARMVTCHKSEHCLFS